MNHNMDTSIGCYHGSHLLLGHLQKSSSHAPLFHLMKRQHRHCCKSFLHNMVGLHSFPTYFAGYYRPQHCFQSLIVLQVLLDSKNYHVGCEAS
ncbi:hypothetical protein JHK82_025144 [Glycine max]|uniref:Uncharacterized protein n=2 Tax=Glycine subgen. Soja TaxID=1462606 RepID=A0A0R0I8F6_SOYBN|nr:hypothetical protein JHK87_025091 [Glycine soja]KAG5007221.1 hypothetical protein JHK85_025763 [Glycine max]KAG5013003.1 hypothetical protein JHK86_025264 [Glycine max]KAG5133956.1 hypothetical protein JHK82_025144 [Glycine max]KAH1043032.1 hypothetical protein GYH30_025054 [Glycine max]